jgi:ferric-dicitrate binding protein FerR (iron transport regulator)
MGGATADEDVELLRIAEEWDRKTANGDPAALEEFGRWILESPRHTEAYLRHTVIRVELTDVDVDREFDLGKMLTEILEPR